MYREIKFRAWDEINNKMAYQGSPDLETIQSFMQHYGDKTLMQSTGLYDRNQKEIYELDLMTYTILNSSGKENCLVGKDSEGRHIYHAIIVFERGSFLAKEINGDGSLTVGFPLSVIMKRETIVGNVFERPDICFLKFSNSF